MHDKATFAESGCYHPGDRGIELCSLNNNRSRECTSSQLDSVGGVHMIVFNVNTSSFSSTIPHSVDSMYVPVARGPSLTSLAMPL